MIEGVAQAVVAEVGDVQNDPEPLHFAQELAAAARRDRPYALVPCAYTPGP